MRVLVADDTAALPDLTGGRILGTRAAGEAQLDACYFDTPDLRLSRARVRVRRDANGADAGWHVDVGQGSSRLEFRFPETRTERVPVAVQRVVGGVTRGAALEPVARVRTARQRLHLLDGTGAVLADVGRDRVVATRLADGVRAEWREIALRMVEGDVGVREHIMARLNASGAAKADLPFRLRLVLGDENPAPESRPSKKSSAGVVLAAYLTEVHERLLRHDVRLRADQADAVHRMRTNARRLRSALAAYRKMFRSDSTRQVEDGLQWLARELSPARDIQVADALLAQFVDEDTLTAGALFAVRPVRMALARSRDSEAEHVDRLLESDAYRHLLDDLAAVVDAPPFRGRASRSARPELRRGVRKAHRRVMERWGAARQTPAADDLDDVREALERLRYACEVAEPALGPDARRLRQLARSVSTALGDRQDIRLVQRTLAESLPTLGASAAARDASFELGQLRARQDGRIRALEEQVSTEIQRLRSSKASRWLT